MAHLLIVNRLQAKALGKKSNVPLMVEYPVPPETAPYLVSAAKKVVLWVNEPHPGDMVKAAVRPSTVAAFFTAVIEAVVEKGTEMEWGNVQPLSKAGVQAAVDHVESYDLTPVELLIPRAHPRVAKPVDKDEDEIEPGSQEAVDLMPPDLRPIIEDIGLPFRPCSWIPEGTIVVVPKDRAFVGVVNKVGPKNIAGLVHNAARGIAIARG